MKTKICSECSLEQPTENFIDIDTTGIDPQESLNEIIKHI